MPKIKILKKFRPIFENTHLFSRNFHIFERFEIPWALLLLETQARRKMPRLRILEEHLDLKNNIYFSKKPKSFIVLKFLKQSENLTRFLDKKCKATCSWKTSRIFSTKKHHFSWKISRFDVLRLHKREQFLKQLLKESIYVECFCKVARIFRIKTFSFSKKNKNFEFLENSWALVKFETHFDKKTCEIKRFRKFSLGFIERFISFSKKK